MKVQKTILDINDRVYATCIGTGEKGYTYIGCSEGPGIARAFTPWGKEDIWTEPGGTMNFVQVPGEDVYYASQKFLPVFNSAECTLNRVEREDGGEWEVRKVLSFPYLHRFDLFKIGEDVYFFGSTLCKSKAFTQDWSTQGSVYVGRLSPDRSALEGLRVIYTGITKNHGLWKEESLGPNGTYFVSGVEGVFSFMIPDRPLEEEWVPVRELESEASDIALSDIDNDGCLELAVIAPFHGNKFTIYHKDDGKWQEMTSYDIEFGHVLWGGRILGENVFLMGYRRARMELSLFKMHKGRYFVSHLIDERTGPSQISVAYDGEDALVLSAGRQINELELYRLSK